MTGRAAVERFKTAAIRGGFLLPALLLGLLVHLPAKTQIKISAAAGRQALKNGGAQTLTRYGLSLKTQRQFDKYFVLARGRVTPEFFGSGEDAGSALKISAALNLGRNAARGRWQAYLSSKRYFYSLSRTANIAFDLLTGGLSFTQFEDKGRQWFAALNYWSRQNQARPGAQLNAVQLSAGRSRLAGSARVSFRLLTEYFTVRPRYDAGERRTNRGGRIGPYVSWSYRRRFVFKGTLFYLYRYSQLTKRPAGEWGGDLILGGLFAKRWSAFIYGRYQKVTSFPRELPVSLLYAPANLENWLYGKIAFDVRRNWELFLKTGWLKDNLPATDERLESIYVVFGIQWRK